MHQYHFNTYIVAQQYTMWKRIVTMNPGLPEYVPIVDYDGYDCTINNRKYAFVSAYQRGCSVLKLLQCFGSRIQIQISSLTATHQSKINTKIITLRTSHQYSDVPTPLLNCLDFRDFSSLPLNNLLRLTGLRCASNSNYNSAFTGVSVKIAFTLDFLLRVYLHTLDTIINQFYFISWNIYETKN